MSKKKRLRELVRWAKQKGRKTDELTRRVFPAFTIQQRHDILWEAAGYPSFFDGDPITALCTQLVAARRLCWQPRRARGVRGCRKMARQIEQERMRRYVPEPAVT